MQKLTKILISIFGEYPYLVYLDLRSRYYPSISQSQAKKSLNAERNKKIAFYSSFIKPGVLCFDIGANIGNRVDPLLSIGAKIVAIEPQIACAKFLRYKFGKRIQVVAKGVGSEHGIKSFYLADALTLSSFSKEWIGSMKTDRFKHVYWNKEFKFRK